MDELQEFHEEIFNDVGASASSSGDFLQRSFFQLFCQYLDDAGEIEMPEYAYYNKEEGNSRAAINGYYLDDKENGDGSLNIFISIYSGLNEISSINTSGMEQAFRWLELFFTRSLEERFFRNMEESSDGYEAASFIFSKKSAITNVNLYLLTDMHLRTRQSSLPPKQVGDVKFNYHLWDLSRLYRLVSSERAPEDIIIDFDKDFNEGLSCLSANFDETEYKAFLAVMPGNTLAKIYEQYGARLLERNVRSFLQAKGKVNKGIRETILREPDMFFAYNNGITATAEAISFKDGKIQSLTNLQIVNGGQTTASLFNAYKKDKANLNKIFVQMKLSVVSQEKADEMVPRISRYANSQNKVNDADFFATHPFHKRIEDFSRRLYAPAASGQLTQSKWFYERARGQYLNGYAYASAAEKKKFQLEYPKAQLVTKTDLAKFEGVWMQLPHIVSKGAQYIFLEYAERVDDKWKGDDKQFNDAYYKIAIAKAITFKAAEGIVTDSSWYNGGYRANIVAYALSWIAHSVSKTGKSVDFMKIWNKQSISSSFKSLLENLTEEVNDRLLNNNVISNVGQYCKRPACWEAIKQIDIDLPESFLNELIDEKDLVAEVKAAKSGQKIENDIEVEKRVLDIGETNWKKVLEFGKQRKMINTTEDGILSYLFKKKFVSAKQGRVLLALLEKLQAEGFILDTESVAGRKEVGE